MSALTIGSLCTGYGGLELGLDAAIGETRIAWVADPEPGPRTVLTHRRPDAPNHGDITTIDWARVEPVDILSAGTPCQGFSLAGRRGGLADPRSGLVHDMLAAVEMIRPRMLVWENVASVASKGIDGITPISYIVNALHGVGYESWRTVVAASDVHAPHRRRRCILVAARNLDDARDLVSVPMPVQTCARPTVGLLPTPTASMATGPGRTGRQGGPNLQTAVAEGRWCDDGVQDRLIHWRNITGWPMPAPVDPNGRMTARWAEWLMGLEPGWVTSVDGLTRTQQMRLLGNGVVPRQAQLAITRLLCINRSPR